MTPPLITSMMVPQAAPAAATTAPVTAENMASGGFQPVLTALSQAMAVASTPPAAEVAMTGEGGSGLPPDGESLPPTATPAPHSAVVDEIIDVDAVLQPVAVAAAAVDAVPPPSTTPMTAELQEEVAPDPDTALEPESTVIPLFATGDTLPPPAAVAGQPAPDRVIATPTPPVSGDIKRPLPESSERRSVVGRAEAAATSATDVASAKSSAAAPVAPVASVRAESAPVATDVSALAGTEVAESPSIASTGAAAARDNPLRAYQGTAPAMAQVDVPVGRPGWSEAVLEKVMWFSAQRIGSAEIHLNPAELGPLSVRISTHQDQASVYFSSHHAAVRDAVDQALPRLREMFDGQGIQLLDAGVGEQRHARHQASTQRQGDGALTAAESDDSQHGAIADGSTIAVRVSNRLVDAYV